MDVDVTIQRNWGKFMLDYLGDRICKYHETKGRYEQGCLLFLQVH